MWPLTLLVLAQWSPMLEKVEQQEALNDVLEDHFDAVCGGIKAGRRDQLGPRPTRIVWATACSLRALSLDGKGDARTVRFLWEVEGRDAAGARVSERGEANGEVRGSKGAWAITKFEDDFRQTVARDQPRFVERAADVGLVLPVPPGEQSMAEMQSGGLSVRDVDGDGRPDVVALSGRTAYLFRNGPGGFKREEVFTAPRNRVLTSAVLGDFDEDGDPDLVLTPFPNQAPWIFKNEKGAFVDPKAIPKAAGRLHSGVASDLDDDGHLDLVLLSYPLGTTLPSDPLKAENGDALKLFKGDGKLGFAPWPIPAKVLTRRWSLAAMAVDLLGQGRPQLYVANDFGDNDLWRFEADGGVANLAAKLKLDDPGNGMSVDFGDVDNDGTLDLYVANMFSKAGTRVVHGATAPPAMKARLEKFVRGNTLYFSEGDGGFTEAGTRLGVNRGLWAFGSLLLDTDDDGRLEVAVANGFFSHPKRKDL